MSKISLLPTLANPDGDELVPVTKAGRTWAASLGALARGLIIPHAVATVETNTPDATVYLVTPPPGFDLGVHGARFDFIIPETNLSSDKLYLTVVGVITLQIEMVIGQKLRARWRAEFTTNRNGNRFTLERQSPDAVSLGDMLTDVGHVDPDPDNANTANHWFFRSRAKAKIFSSLKFTCFAPSNVVGPVDVTIDGFTARLRKSSGNDLDADDIRQNELLSVVYPEGGQNSFFVAAKGIAQRVPAPVVTDSGMPLPVDSPIFSQTDYPARSIVTKTGTSLRIVRPVDPTGQGLAVPNARDRCRVSATWLEWVVMHGVVGFMPAPKTPLVLVDGVPVIASISTAGAVGAYTVRTIRVPVGTSASHDVELVWPYEGPMEIIGRRASSDLIVSSNVPTARPAKLLVTAGDSLTHGYEVGSMHDQWAYLLAKALGYRIVNHGYAGRRLLGADGAVYGGEGGAITTYLILANDVSAGTPLADVTARLGEFWTDFFGAHPEGTAAKLLMISQPWMENGDGGVPSPIPGAQYRTTMQNAVAAAVGKYPNLRYKNGAELSDGAGDWTDGTHFKSVASRERVAPRLEATIRSIAGWVASAG